MFVKKPVPHLLPPLTPAVAPATRSVDVATVPPLADPTTEGWGPEPKRLVIKPMVTPEERRLFMVTC